MPKYRLLKGSFVWEEAIVEADDRDDAWEQPHKWREVEREWAESETEEL